ncbi:hypothetical protein PMAYCL1PPCAC_25536, partial [Pristionchus mayeri]
KALRLNLLEQFKLNNITSHCLLAISTMSEIYKLQSTPEFANFSDKLKLAILDRLTKLAKSSS